MRVRFSKDLEPKLDFTTNPALTVLNVWAMIDVQCPSVRQAQAVV